MTFILEAWNTQSLFIFWSITSVVADAGDDASIALPLTRAVLNGTRSKDDIKIVLYHWEQVRYNFFNFSISCVTLLCILDCHAAFFYYSGPNNAEFAAVNESVTNITKLTKGDYVFKLTVVDDNGNVDSDTVNVKITQSMYRILFAGSSYISNRSLRIMRNFIPQTKMHLQKRTLVVIKLWQHQLAY